MLLKIEEITETKQQVYQIDAKHGIRKVYMFGSVACSESNDISDIDILNERNDNPSASGVAHFITKSSNSWG